MEKKYNFRDPVVRRVVDKFVDRSDTGYEKYGKTLNEERTQGFKDLGGYLNDIQEELMDAILYIQAAREEVQDLVEDLALRNAEPLGSEDSDYDSCYNNGECDYNPSNEF